MRRAMVATMGAHEITGRLDIAYDYEWSQIEIDGTSLVEWFDLVLGESMEVGYRKEDGGEVETWGPVRITVERLEVADG